VDHLLLRFAPTSLLWQDAAGMEDPHPIALAEARQALELPIDVVHRSSEELVTSLCTAGASVTYVTRAVGCGPVVLAQTWLRRNQRPLVYVTASSEQLSKALEDFQALLPQEQVLALQASESNPYAATQPDRRATMSRLATLTQLSLGRPWNVLVTSAQALVQKVVPADVLRSSVVTLRKEQEVDITDLAARLDALGYIRVPVVEDPGGFSIRGGLVDVWSADADAPCRLDLFGDWIMGLKTFDPETQRTTGEVLELTLSPARETILTPAISQGARERLRELCDACNTPSSRARQLIEELVTGRNTFGVSGLLPAFYPLASLWSLIPRDALIITDDSPRVAEAIKSALTRVDQDWQTHQDEPFYPPDTLYLPEQDLTRELDERTLVCCASGFVRGKGDKLERLELAEHEAINLVQSTHDDLQRAVKLARSSQGKRAALEPLVERLELWQEHGLKTTVMCRTVAQARRLDSLLKHRQVPTNLDETALDVTAASGADAEPSDIRPLGSAGVKISVGKLARGLISPLDALVYLTEEEVFGHRAHGAKTRSSKKARHALEDLRALTPGDYIVHVEHGIGRYVGLENRPGPGGIHLELLVVEYLGGKLFLPVYRLNQVQKYSSGDKPKLDRLGGQTFAKTKAKARRQARAMADELLRLYAERNSVVKKPLEPADDDFAAFEAAFPYEETPDQAAAIADVLSDLEKPQVMDRLVCGDVGFGKTEVALRAAFRVAASGRQVAILCPTTVLAQQHYLTFLKRLADYPFNVRVLSRFQGKKAATETLKGLVQGSVDIIVGTHRLLSKDLHFKNLGLLVVDEEQRFGVIHKERIKQLRTSVDVLTLTATPIPRTLQLAVGGLREMSIIATAPVNRRAIRTIVSRYEDTVLVEAIERELKRGGQVYYVYNRIEGLYERAHRLQQLLPNAKIAVGHGQLSEAELERTMLDFVEGEFDVLVATAIVESGLDIPRANTMIIDRADLFGLAQLYQLRGRVGRSSERAYCYLLVPAPSEMTDEARARIEALERYSELGSGFHVATLDMELRGAGDLLGADQTGTLASVGFELFCQMLEEATAELRGETVEHEIDPELSFDVNALLPDSYVGEVGVRLSLYKRLASARDEYEVAQLAAEMEDRFGPPPEEAARYVELMRIKVDLRRLRILVCEAAGTTVAFRFRDDTPVDAPKLAKLVAESKGRYRLAPDGRLVRRRLDTEPQIRNSLELAETALQELAPLA
jgi:transcription-repair coupling factor (superfamily II helicase)